MRIGKRTLVGAGIFAALIGVEVWLARSMTLSPSIRGFVDTRSYSVSSPAKGLVRKIDVTLGQSVTTGQVIAELDSSSIEAEMVVAMAKRKQVLATRLAATGSAAPSEDEALKVVDLELEQLAEKRDAMRLKSPTDGVVESIDVRPGDAISPASAVATVVAADTRRVLACIPESRISEVEVGRVAEVTSVVGDRTVNGVVESVTPAIAAMPPRCQPPFARIAVLGRMAVLVLDEAIDLLPGQSELIAFKSERRAVSAAAAPSPLNAAPELIDVPPEIVAVLRFEASGLVWVPGLDRYVIVSDETGVDGSHPPWLFTMSRRGVVDPEPLIVEEIKQLDDIESIAADDHQGLYVLASQSISERGNRPKAREKLVHLVPERGSYRADREVALAQLLDDSPPATRTALGLTDTQSLDIEGMAWRGGALFLGLKAPLDDQGRALIWRIGAPDKLFAGDLAGAAVVRWGSVSLPIEIDGRPAPGGIADMMFTSDTTLVVGATASGISSK
ncbi:MAG: efflux RND transporter periplasmic adaptor subunit, partial [Polyangiales bacterium]